MSIHCSNNEPVSNGEKKKVKKRDTEMGDSDALGPQSIRNTPGLYRVEQEDRIIAYI